MLPLQNLQTFWQETKKNRIIPRNIQLAIRNDEELASDRD